MTNNLYEQFGCKSKEELYEKVKNEDESVKSLVDFMDYVKADIYSKTPNITGPDILVNYATHAPRPSKDNGVFIFVNTKNQPVLLTKTRLSRKKEVRQSIKEGLESGAASVFPVFNDDTSFDKKQQFLDLFHGMGMNAIDTLTYSKNHHGELFRSSMAERNYAAKKDYYIAGRVNLIEREATENHFSRTKEYKEFSSFFAKQEIEGLHIVQDVEKIKEKLKLGFQHHDREVLGVISYNENGKVIDVEQLFKGGINATVVDQKILFKKVLNTEELKGFAVFHNHPSGKTDPSNEDIKMTEVLSANCKMLDIEFLDHFVVGKEKVLSICEEVSLNSHNNDYQKKLADDVKESQSTYNEKKHVLNSLYWYEMTAHPISPGAQPDGFMEWDEDKGKYGVVAYEKALTEKEMTMFQMKEWNEEKEQTKAKLKEKVGPERE